MLHYTPKFGTVGKQLVQSDTQIQGRFALGLDNGSGYIPPELIPTATGNNYVIVPTTASPQGNAANLAAAISFVRTTNPNGAPVSPLNPYTILLPPDIYDFGTTSLSLIGCRRGTYIVGMGASPESTMVKSYVTGSGLAVIYLSGAVSFSNLSISGGDPNRNIGSLSGNNAAILKLSGDNEHYYFNNVAFYGKNLLLTKQQQSISNTITLNNCDYKSAGADNHSPSIGCLTGDNLSIRILYPELSQTQQTLDIYDCDFAGKTITANNTNFNFYNVGAVWNPCVFNNCSISFNQMDLSKNFNLQMDKGSLLYNVGSSKTGKLALGGNAINASLTLKARLLNNSNNSYPFIATHCNISTEGIFSGISGGARWIFRNCFFENLDQYAGSGILNPFTPMSMSFENCSFPSGFGLSNKIILVQTSLASGLNFNRNYLYNW